MINGKKILAIIPARGGSKGVPRKNIKLLGNKPLLAWTIEAGLNSKYIDRVILSSDDDEIAAVARQFNCDVPFIRPPELASDTADSVSVVLHALGAISAEYDYFVLLQPTSPFRSAVHIDSSLELMFKRDAHSIVSVVESEANPYWMCWVNDEGRMQNVLDGAEKYSRRQELPIAYLVNGAIYIIEVKKFLEDKKFVLDDTLAFKMSNSESIDIDTLEDFELAENKIRKNLV